MDAWLAAAADALAAEAGVSPDLLDLDEAAEAILLDLARVAAHESGDRTNAPLLCYLVGLASTGTKGLDELADTVRRSSS